MKKGRPISGILFLLLGVLITGCNKDNNNSASDEQMQEVLENAQLVMNNVNNYYEEAESVSDMALHLNEIKQMEDVEDAWQEDLSIAVKIKDGGIIKWCFFPHNTTPSETSFAHNKIMNIKSSEDALCEEKSACISITVPYDEWRLEESDIELLNTIGDAFEEKDYSVRMVLGSDVTPSFIYNQLPQYGVNILITHGDCDTNGKHWIMTGVELNNATMIENVQNWMTKSEWVSNRTQLWYVKESRNGEWVEPLYLAISEDCINEKMNQHFPKNSLMFAWACSTVKSNSGLWTILKNKGLGCYFGYDNPVNTNRAHNDLLAVMQNMLGYGYNAEETYTQVGANTNPELKIYPANSNVTLVGCDCNLIDTCLWVDLGLPSGLLWASQNVGADRPEDYGNYYAWGEISPKSIYSKDSYQYFELNEAGYYRPTKYCDDTNSGYHHFADYLTVLESIDDAATVNIGNGARTPTKEEWMELLQNTTECYTSINGVNGRCLTGTNGNSIFLPASGFYIHDDIYVGASDGLNFAGSSCWYWSSSVCTKGSGYDQTASWSVFSSRKTELIISVCGRSSGLTIRPVRSPN